MQQYTQQQLSDFATEINNLDHEQMAYLWRFSKAGHPYFRSDLPLFELFNKRFKEFGGWTPEISKKIGWEQ